MLPRNSVGTKQLQKGAVTPAKLSKASRAKLIGATGATGPQGPLGQMGPPGKSGESATSLLAHVAIDGSLIGGTGVTNTELLAPGEYEVDFNRGVAQCNYQATLAADESPGSVIVEPRLDEPDGVFVETTNSAGANINDPFYLAVFCP